MVAAADGLASQAGALVLQRGGNAIDAAIATSAAMAVVAPHLCGMGGDLFALVSENGVVSALDAAGRAGSGADAAAMRNEGLTSMPMHGDIRAVTVPGCVAGWTELHRRFGQISLDEVLAPAIRLAEDGFAASPLLCGSLRGIIPSLRENFSELITQVAGSGSLVCRPGVARTLRAIAANGSDAFYKGEFGDGLLTIGHGLFSPIDMDNARATWVTPLVAKIYDKNVYSIPAPSQGYLTLTSLGLAQQLDLPQDADDPHWAHLLIECSTAAGYDRPEVLHDQADLAAFVRTRSQQVSLIDHQRALNRRGPGANGDTTYLCVVDSQGMGVSLINSNASGFGSGLVEQLTGINLHNRGLGFSLQQGHVAELAPGHQPPHTLCPALITNNDGSLLAVLGTMGGDAQPQVLLQIITRLLHNQQLNEPFSAINAGRWVLRGATSGFDSWTGGQPATVQLEGHAPAQWIQKLAAYGHKVEMRRAYDSVFGHAHGIIVRDDNTLVGGADPRSVVGSCVGI